MQLNIPVAKEQRIVAAMVGLFPIPLIPDPEWTGEPDEIPLVPEFTGDEWAKEAIVRWIKVQEHRWRVSEAIKTARESTIIDADLLD